MLPFEGTGIYTRLGKGWCGLVGTPFGLGGALRWSRTIVDGVQEGFIPGWVGGCWVGWCWAEWGIAIVQGYC